MQASVPVFRTDIDVQIATSRPMQKGEIALEEGTWAMGTDTRHTTRVTFFLPGQTCAQTRLVYLRTRSSSCQ